MSKKEITLTLASFMDSEHSKKLETSPEDQRRVAAAFLAVCYEEIGKAPHLLDGQDMHAALGHCVPGRLKRKDPLAEEVPPILHALVEHLTEEHVLAHAFEIRAAIESTRGEFIETVRTGNNPHHHGGPKQETVVHKAAKLGRNDPCFCGSGKKFKKCCGKNS